MKALTRLALFASLTAPSAFALVDKNFLPERLHRNCGTVTSIERDTTRNHVVQKGKKLELVIGITSPSGVFTGGFSVDRKVLKDEYMKSLIMYSLGKNVCINYSTDNRFWVEAIEVLLTR